LQLVLMVFGAIGFVLAIRHWLVYIHLRRGHPPTGLAWLKMHIGMMMGAYIATVTAFVVVNYKIFSFLHLPDWFFWLFPSMVLSPFIVYWTRKYTGGKERKLV
jgi:hypothetical protein